MRNMPFTAQIVFTGICGIVPRRNQPNPPEAFCVVLPNAWKPEPDPENMKLSSVDDVSRIRRHTPFVRFTTHPRDPHNNRQDLEGLWFLQGHRLVVNPTFASPPPPLPPLPPPPPAWGAIGGLARFDDIATSEFHPQLSVRNAVLNPNPAIVAAQVVLHHGELSSIPGNPLWVFDSYLRRSAGLPATRRLNHLVTVTLQNLTSLEVVRQDFNGNPTGRSFTFSTGPAFVTVANLCDMNPLQWGEETAPESLSDDDDFRLHYEIVDDPAALRLALGDDLHFRCPIPRITGDFAGGGGLNCDGLLFSEVDFTF